MDTADLSGMLTGIAAIIGALAALMTAIVAFRNSKKPTAPHSVAQPAPATSSKPQYVQGIPDYIQPKRNVSTAKLIGRFVVGGILTWLFAVWFNSLYIYESPLGYALALIFTVLFLVTLAYGVRLLYRLLVALFLH